MLVNLGIGWKTWLRFRGELFEVKVKGVGYVEGRVCVFLMRMLVWILFCGKVRRILFFWLVRIREG